MEKSDTFPHSATVWTVSLAHLHVSANTEVSRRDRAFDILKGIGITEVMLHHLLSHSSRKYTEHGSFEYWALMIANRVLHFAIPMFLLVSALLLAKSLAKNGKPDWRKFFSRRAQYTLWPYLLWSGIYIVFRLTVLQRYPDMAPTAAYLPGVGEFVGPHLIANGAEVTKNLLWGKSYFHLYFMSVLLQLTLIFPLLFFALRKIQMQFGTVLISALGLQGIVYFVQMSHLQARFPASMVIWYVPSVLLGVWLGLNWHQWEEIWRKYRWGLAAGATGGLALYLYWSIVRMTGGTIPLSMYYSGSFIIYSTSISLVLLALAQKIEGTRAGDFLRLIGNWSIALFLVHPIILYYLSGPTITGVLGRMPFSPLWSGLLMFGTACAFIWLTIRLRADLWLFGRRLGENRTGASWLHVIGPREAPVRALEAKPLAATTTDSVA